MKIKTLVVLLCLDTLFHMKQPYFINIDWFMSYTQTCTKSQKKADSTKNAIISKPMEKFISKLDGTFLKPVSKLGKSFKFFF